MIVLEILQASEIYTATSWECVVVKGYNIEHKEYTISYSREYSNPQR